MCSHTLRYADARLINEAPLLLTRCISPHSACIPDAQQLPPTGGLEGTALLRKLVDAPAVARLEPNAITTTGLPAGTLDSEAMVDTNATTTEGTDATLVSQTQRPVPSWGLDRVDGVMDAAYSYTSTGTGVCAYMLDTGILGGNPNYASRLLPGAYVSFPTDNPDQGTNDANGHGTHTVRHASDASSLACHPHACNQYGGQLFPLFYVLV